MLETKELPQVTPESPMVVKGGPLDPTSPEGKPPEDANAQLELPVTPKEEEPLYRGFTGDIKTADDLKAYAKNLEDLLARASASQALQSPAQPVAPLTSGPNQVAQGPSPKERFSELIFSKPEEAYEIAVQQAEERVLSRLGEQERQKRTQEQFWSRFYEKHQDLKNYGDIVQSIVKAKNSEIVPMKTEQEVSEFISKESRKLVDSVKKQLGVREVQVSSEPAMTFGGSKEVPVRGAPPTQAPLNFTDQIKRLRPRLAGNK